MSVLPWDHLRAPALGRQQGASSEVSELPSASAMPASLTEQFVAYRRGEWDGVPHSLAETATHFGIDPFFASRIDSYLQARQRLSLSRAGWRAALPRGR